MNDLQFHNMHDGRRIAFRFLAGTGPAASPTASPTANPTVVFLPGYMSDMDGGKATATLEWARESGRSCLLLDYSGCGQSGGDFADGSLSRWTEEVLALIEAHANERVILIGSSMGGWLMLLVARQLESKLAGMVGIAAAPDFSDWGFTDGQKALLRSGETVLENNPYGPEPTPTHALFWQDAEEQKQLADIIPIDCPVRLLQGQADEDVPWQTSLTLAEQLRSDDIQVMLVKSGDHRLSRDEDIALLLRTLDALATTD